MNVANLLGFLALVFYAVTLMPNILRIVFPQIKQSKLTKILLQYRRQLGVIYFIFAMGHGYLFFEQRQVNLLDAKSYIIYFHDIILTLVFTIITITSNDISVRLLKAKQWKKMHRITYFAMFLIAYHILETTWNHFSFYTPLCWFLIITTIALFLIRKGVEA